MTSLIEQLEWRYATKKYDATATLAQDKLDRIVEAVRLAASSNGLQPYELLVVRNRALRERIQPVAMNQQQIVDCACLLVFAAWDDVTAARIDTMFDLAIARRGGSSEAWENYREFLRGRHAGQSAEANHQHAARQAYIGLGTALVAAAAEQVDSTPMEGFDPDGLDALLGLRAKGLRSVALLALGQRDADADWLVKLPKVRRARDNFATDIV